MYPLGMGGGPGGIHYADMGSRGGIPLPKLLANHNLKHGVWEVMEEAGRAKDGPTSAAGNAGRVPP